MTEITACVFGSTYAFHLIAEGLTVRRFSGIILPDLPFLPLQGFEATHPIFDDVANTVARCFSPLTAKR